MVNQSSKLRIWRREVSPGLYDVNVIICISIREGQGDEETHRRESNKKSGNKQTNKNADRVKERQQPPKPGRDKE